MATKYTCSGHNALASGETYGRGEDEIRVDDPSDAARVFAGRTARADYGRRGCVGALRLDSWSEDGTFCSYEAFIGSPAVGGGVDGRNIQLHISIEAGA